MRRRFRCFTSCAPAWCDRGATLSETSIRSKWMKRLLVAVQRARGGVHHKATVAGAVEVRTRPPAAEGKKHKRTIYAGRLRLRLVPGRGANEPREFVQENVVKGAVVRTDGWKGYDDLALWATRTNPWRLMETPKEPMLTFRWPTSPSRTSRHGCLERITGSVIIACRLISTNLCFGSIGASTR